MAIKVIDSIMGSGKSTYAINMINANPEKRYIFISVILKEVERVKENCANFEEPEEYTEYGQKCLKLDSFHQLLKQGKNIASTHALFKLTTQETLEYLKKWNYVLIIDEVLQVVETETIPVEDLDNIIKLGYVEIDPVTKYMIWKKDYTGESWQKIMIMAKTKSLYVMGEGTKKQSLIWIFPAMIFNYFSDVYVLTYLFDCQPLRYYFDMQQLEFSKYRISDGHMVAHNGYIDDTSKYRELITIYQGKKNNIGGEGESGTKKQNCLCSTWYNDAGKDINRKKKDPSIEDRIERLRKDTYGYFFNDLKRSPSNLNMWTCFKEYQPRIEEKGYKTGFLACNARAINDFQNKTALAYLINVFMNPVIERFFTSQGIKIDKKQQEQYALSEMLQWIWRSAIRQREPKPINIYIPSCRMRRLLKQYLGIPK